MSKAQWILGCDRCDPPVTFTAEQALDEWRRNHYWPTPAMFVSLLSWFVNDKHMTKEEGAKLIAAYDGVTATRAAFSTSSDEEPLR